jgi:hypothetical protein
VQYALNVIDGQDILAAREHVEGAATATDCSQDFACADGRGCSITAVRVQRAISIAFHAYKMASQGLQLLFHGVKTS